MALDHWTSDFGDAYHARNSGRLLHARARLWAKILDNLEPMTILEVGAGDGMNLRALSALTAASLHAVEPNDTARRLISGQAVPGTAQALPFTDASMDLVFTWGVLIHIPPDDLNRALDEIYRVSGRWIACVECFSREPTEILYRGHRDMLFKRDFGSAWLDRFTTLEVLRDGFAWRRSTQLDDLTWCLLEKRP